MAQGDDSWENRSLAFFRPAVDWHFQTESPDFKEIVQSQGEDAHFSEDERHGYRRENCPAGYAWIGAPPPPVFNDGDSIDRKNPSVCWRFGYNDPNFRCRAVNVPPCFHLKEEEFHEYHRKEGDYKSRCDTQKPCPVLPPPDCCSNDPEDCCCPIPRACAPCQACVPPPVEPQCVQYGNTLGEREWHSVNKMNCTPEGLLSDENEVSQYERKIKTCEPCDLPQTSYERAFRLPCSRMRPNDADNYSPENPPCPEDLPPVYDYKEDSGECSKRETRGCGPYDGPGFTVTRPFYQPECVPCGYYYVEQATQCHSKKVGEEPPGPLPEKPCPPGLPCPPRCVPPCPSAPPCGPNPCPTSCERPNIACPIVCPSPPNCPVPCPRPCPSPCPNPCESSPPPCPRPPPKICPKPCPPHYSPCGPCPPPCSPCSPCPPPCSPCSPCPPPCSPCSPYLPPCSPCSPCPPPCSPCGPCPPPCSPCGPCPPPCPPCGPCLPPCPPCGPCVPCPKPCISYPCIPYPRIYLPCPLPSRPCSPSPCGPCSPCTSCPRPCPCPCPRPCPIRCPCPPKCPCPCPPKCPCPCPPKCPCPCPPKSPCPPACPSPPRTPSPPPSTKPN